MEPNFKEYEEYLTEIQNYRKNTLDDISNKYTNNGSQDFLIDMKTLKTISYKDAEPRIPSYSTLTSYFCEPAHKLLEELSSYQEKDKDTSQKEPLEWGKDSGIGSDTSSTAESSQESSISSDEEFAILCRGHNSKVSEKNLDSSQKKSKRDILCRGHDGKVSVKDLDSSEKKSKREFSFRRHDSKVSEDLDSSLKIPICELSIRKSDSKVFEKDLDSSLKKSKWVSLENRKPNVISVRRDPALKRDTSFLRNIQLDDCLSISRSLSKSSNSINCSSK